MADKETRRGSPKFRASAGDRLLTWLEGRLERRLDRLLFDCQSCDFCLLYETAFICPMTCSKGLRNGPCRGSTPQSCFVDASRSCTWFRIFEQAEARGTLDRLLEVNPPAQNNWELDQTGSTAHGLCHQHGTHLPRLRDYLKDPARFESDWKSFHNQQRKSSRFQGDSLYHPPGYSQPVSKLEAAMRDGHFVVSAELAPPLEPCGDGISRTTEFLEGYVDTVNFTDNPRGVARMSGLACSIISLQNGLEPVLQIQTRYRPRHDLEAEAVGASEVGVHNILCLCDDTGRLGPGPRPRPGPVDIDTVQALWILRRLRDEGIDADGEHVDHRPSYFLGSSASPYASRPLYEAILTEKKINAGAQFIQTLPVFDLARFTEWMEALDKRDLLGKAYLIASVLPLRNPRQARFVANEVAGVWVPPTIRARVEKAIDPREEGIEIALDLISELKSMKWIRGIHVLAPEGEDVVPRLVRESGLKSVPPSTKEGSGNGHNKTNLDRTSAGNSGRAVDVQIPSSKSSRFQNLQES